VKTPWTLHGTLEATAVYQLAVVAHPKLSGLQGPSHTPLREDDPTLRDLLPNVTGTTSLLAYYHDVDKNNRPVVKDVRTAYENTPYHEAFAHAYATDAHFVTYTVCKGTETLRFQPRINKGAGFAHLRAEGFRLETWWIAIDVDTFVPVPPGVSRRNTHVAWEAHPTPHLKPWLLAILDQFQVPCAVYFTSKGARLLFALAEPVPTETVEPLIAAVIGFLRSIGLNADETGEPGLSADEACKDWTRHFRLPNVLRERKPFRTIVDISRLRTVRVTPDAPLLEVSDGGASSAIAAPRFVKPRPTQVPTAWTQTVPEEWTPRVDHIVATIREHVPAGTYNSLVLALSGALCSLGVDLAMIPILIQAISERAGFGSAEKDRASAARTVKRYVGKENTRGLRTLKDHWPHVHLAVRAVVAWKPRSNRVHLHEEEAMHSVLKEMDALYATFGKPAQYGIVCAETGLGKTKKAMDLMIQKALSGKNCALSCSTNTLSIESYQKLWDLCDEYHIPLVRYFGAMSIEEPDPRACLYWDRAKHLPLHLHAHFCNPKVAKSREAEPCERHGHCAVEDGAEANRWYSEQKQASEEAITHTQTINQKIKNAQIAWRAAIEDAKSLLKRLEEAKKNLEACMLEKANTHQDQEDPAYNTLRLAVVDLTDSHKIATRRAKFLREELKKTKRIHKKGKKVGAIYLANHFLLPRLVESIGQHGMLFIDEPPNVLETLALTFEDLANIIECRSGFDDRYMDLMMDVVNAVRGFRAKEATRAEIVFQHIRGVEDALPLGYKGTTPPLKRERALAIRMRARSGKEEGEASKILKLLYEIALAATDDRPSAVKYSEDDFRGKVTLKYVPNLVRDPTTNTWVPSPDGRGVIQILRMNPLLTEALFREHSEDADGEGNGCTLILDANAETNLPFYKKAFSMLPTAIQKFTAPDGNTIRRIWIEVPGARKYLMPDKAPHSEAARLALQTVAEHITHTDAQGFTDAPERYGIITFMPLATALRLAKKEELPADAWKKKWGDAGTAVAMVREALPEPLLRRIVVGHYGAIRGLDHMNGCSIVTIGDPWSNPDLVLDEAQFFGLSEEEFNRTLELRMKDELEQAQGRGRTPHAKAPQAPLHLGSQEPGGSGWRQIHPANRFTLAEKRPGRKMNPKVDGAKERLAVYRSLFPNLRRRGQFSTPAFCKFLMNHGILVSTDSMEHYVFNEREPPKELMEKIDQTVKLHPMFASITPPQSDTNSI
jgi:hypothetical protein